MIISIAHHTDTKIDTHSSDQFYLLKDGSLVIESASNLEKLIFTKEMTTKIAKCLNNYGLINVAEYVRDFK